MAPSHIFQIFLRVTVQNQIGIAQRIVVDEIIQLRSLCHGHIQRILDPSAINGDHSPIPEQQLHAAGVHVEFAGSFIVLHVCVLSALRHLYSCDFRYTVFLLIRFRTHSGREEAGIIISEENKKSEPFSYREKVRIFIVWCDREGFAKPRPRNAPPGRFCPAGRKARGTGCSNPFFCCPIKSAKNKKSSTP